MLATRCLATVLALVVGGTPVVTTVCHAACAARTADAAAGAFPAHHSCHAAPPRNGAGFTDLAHNCGHSDGDDQVSADQTLKLPTPSTVALAFFTLVAPVVAAGGAADRHLEHSPPGSDSLPTQLRI